MQRERDAVSEEIEINVEAEIQQVLERYQVAVEINEEASCGNEIVLVCQATHRDDDEVVAALTLHLPINSGTDFDAATDEDAQSQYISLAIVAMAKLLMIQEQTRPEFNPFSGNVAEA